MAEPGEYRRDQVTWTGFTLLGVWAAILYFIGPASSAIGEDLELSGAEVGAIGTFLALGNAASALLGPRAVRRWGRKGALLRLLVALSAAVAMLAAGIALAIVLVSVLAIGAFGATVANTSTAVLSDRHRAHAPRAITEANAVASWLGVLSPALLGFALALPTGWRGAAAVLAVVPLVALLRVRSLPATSEPVVGDDEVSRGERQPMQRAFWPALVVVGAAVAMEFSINFWAAPLVQQRTGVPLAAAAAALSALTLGMALGRTFAAGLSSRFPLQRLIVGCFLIASTGLAALLMSASYPASLAALFCTGLGLSLLFPFAQSWALELAGSSADRAVALTALPIAIAIGTAPFVLGVLAGAVGLTGALAFGFVIALVGIAATAAVILARRTVG